MTAELAALHLKNKSLLECSEGLKAQEKQLVSKIRALEWECRNYKQVIAIYQSENIGLKERLDL